MQIGEMRRVDVAFERLQVVAIEDGLLQEEVIASGAQEFVIRQQRRLAFSHIGKNHPGALGHRIGEVTDLVLVFAVGRLGRLFKTAARDIEKPAVIEAAQPAILEAAVREIGAAMRAENAEQPYAALLVAEKDEIFAEKADRLRRAARRQFGRQCDRVPVAAHQRAARRARPGLSQESVFLARGHSWSPAHVSSTEWAISPCLTVSCRESQDESQAAKARKPRGFGGVG